MSKVFVKVWFQDGFYFEKEIRYELGFYPLIEKHGLITDLIVFHEL